jgi:type II secretory pathway component PulK
MNRSSYQSTSRLQEPGPSAQAAGARRVVARRRPIRRGVVLLVGIVCLAVAGALFLSLLRLSIAERHRVDTEGWHLQAAWIAESGIERAAARLQRDADYEGETWRMPAEVLGTEHGAAVRIEVERVADQPQQRTVRVEADYPDPSQRRARYSKHVRIELRPSASSERR